MYLTNVKVLKAIIADEQKWHYNLYFYLLRDRRFQFGKCCQEVSHLYLADVHSGPRWLLNQPSLFLVNRSLQMLKLHALLQTGNGRFSYKSTQISTSGEKENSRKWSRDESIYCCVQTAPQGKCYGLGIPKWAQRVKKKGYLKNNKQKTTSLITTTSFTNIKHAQIFQW